MLLKMPPPDEPIKCGKRLVERYHIIAEIPADLLRDPDEIMIFHRQLAGFQIEAGREIRQARLGETETIAEGNPADLPFDDPFLRGHDGHRFRLQFVLYAPGKDRPNIEIEVMEEHYPVETEDVVHKIVLLIE